MCVCVCVGVGIVCVCVSVCLCVSVCVYIQVWEVFLANAAEQEVVELESAGELVRSHCLLIVAN